MNARLLANDPPGWSAKELLDELLTRTVRIVAFDLPFSIPDALLRDEKFAANAGYTRGAFIGWRTFKQLTRAKHAVRRIDPSANVGRLGRLLGSSRTLGAG